MYVYVIVNILVIMILEYYVDVLIYYDFFVINMLLLIFLLFIYLVEDRLCLDM